MPSTIRLEKDQVRKEKRREDLLSAAAKVFAAQGYHKTLISDIVQTARVGQGTFYRYFADKREIFEALFDRFEQDLLSHFASMTERLPETAEDYLDASLRGISAAADQVERNRDLVALFLREAGSVDRDFERRLTGLYDRFADLARFYLDHAVEKGYARPCRTEIVSQQIVGMSVWLANLWWNGRFPDVSMKQMIEEAVQFAFFGLVAFSPAAPASDAGTGPDSSP